MQIAFIYSRGETSCIR